MGNIAKSTEIVHSSTVFRKKQCGKVIQQGFALFRGSLRVLGFFLTEGFSPRLEKSPEPENSRGKEQILVKILFFTVFS